MGHKIAIGQLIAAYIDRIGITLGQSIRNASDMIPQNAFTYMAFAGNTAAVSPSFHIGAIMHFTDAIFL